MRGTSTEQIRDLQKSLWVWDTGFEAAEHREFLLECFIELLAGGFQVCSPSPCHPWRLGLGYGLAMDLNLNHRYLLCFERSLTKEL